MSNIANATAGVSASAASGGKSNVFGNNVDTFLKLLTTQLKNQNPTSPMDTTAFTSQLVQFSQIEQMMNLGTSFKEVSGRIDDGNFVQATSLVGRQVEVSAPSVLLSEGEAKFTVNLDRPSSATSIMVLDDQGRALRHIDGPTTAGGHDIAWDGRADNGLQLPDGQYTVRITALSADGTPTELSPTVTTLVNGVIRNATGTQLLTGVGGVPLANLVGLVS